MAPPPFRRAVPIIVAGGLALSACADSSTDAPTAVGSPATTGADPTGATPADSTASPAGGDAALPPPVVLDVPDPNSIYDPVRGGEELPLGFRQVLGRDDIAPVYDPTFVTASGVDWPEESLVIGVDLEGEARAYPVGFLNRREIVNDNHRGIPTLVTW